jgi:hypothetical protein
MGAVVLLLVLVAFVAVANHGSSHDDAYITFRYAVNFARGEGLVYNVGDEALGTSAPLFALVLGVLGLPNPDAIPAIGGAMSALALAAVALALYMLARAAGHPLCGLLSGILVGVNPWLHASFGDEMLVQAALVLWAIVLYRAERDIAAASLLALAVLVRPDSLVAVGVIGAHSIFVRREFPVRPAIAFAVVVTPFALLAWATYGSPFPETLAAKQAQRDSGFWNPFLFDSLRRTSNYFFASWNRHHLFGPEVQLLTKAFLGWLALAGLPMLIVHRFWLLPLAWILTVTLSYQVADVPMYFWYGVPPMIGIMMLAASGASMAFEAASRVVRKRSVPHLARAGVVAGGGVAVAVLVAGLVDHAQARFGKGEPSRPVYFDTGRWLAENTPASASVGYHEIGYLGFRSRRTIVDPLGLVTPAAIPHVARGQLTWAYRRFRPDYLVQRPDVGKGRFGVREPDMRRSYVLVKRFGAPGQKVRVSIYRRAGPAGPAGPAG